MKLIEFDGQDFKVADEAFLMRPVRQMFEKDKSKGKEEFWKQISYLWFMCDPRSTYMYLVDDDERSKEVIQQEGLGENWKPNDLLKEAMLYYTKQSRTSASVLLEHMRSGLDSMMKLQKKLEEAMLEDDFDEDGNPKKKIMPIDKALLTLSKAMSDYPKLARDLAEAEKALAKDYEDDDKARGSATKAVGEDI